MIQIPVMGTVTEAEERRSMFFKFLVEAADQGLIDEQEIDDFHAKLKRANSIKKKTRVTRIFVNEVKRRKKARGT